MTGDLAHTPQGMAIRRHGAGGEGVLWIHGYTMDTRIWSDLWELLPGWRHVGVDLPGHGASPPMPPEMDLAGLGRRIGEIAEERRLSHLVGLSFGGMIALQAAIERPDLFATLTLGAPALAGGPQDPRAQARNLELGRLHRAEGAGPWLGRLWMEPGPAIFEGAARQPALWRRLQEIVAGHAWTELADATMQRLTGQAQSAQALGRIAADTLVLIGSEDAEAFRRTAELIRRAVPTCRRVHMEQTGHLTLLERPREAAALMEAHFHTAAAPAATWEGRTAHG